jgi:hypothetical protein
MSTRAVYSFFDSEGPAAAHVYKHSDGYPSGAIQAIEAALEYAWKLPRYEADEFAAAFAAGNKSYYKEKLFELLSKPERTKADSDNIAHLKEMHEEGYSGGGIRLITPKRADMPAMDAAADFACDLEYRYEIRCKDDVLHVTVFETAYWEGRREKELFAGTLAKMKVWAEKEE